MGETSPATGMGESSPASCMGETSPATSLGETSLAWCVWKPQPLHAWAKPHPHRAWAKAHPLRAWTKSCMGETLHVITHVEPKTHEQAHNKHSTVQVGLQLFKLAQLHDMSSNTRRTLQRNNATTTGSLKSSSSCRLPWSSNCSPGSPPGHGVQLGLVPDHDALGYLALHHTASCELTAEQKNQQANAHHLSRPRQAPTSTTQRLQDNHEPRDGTADVQTSCGTVHKKTPRTSIVSTRPTSLPQWCRATSKCT